VQIFALLCLLCVVRQDAYFSLDAFSSPYWEEGRKLGFSLELLLLPFIERSGLEKFHDDDGAFDEDVALPIMSSPRCNVLNP